MGEMLPDIPRFYTAVAEWLACVVYILPLKKKIKGKKLAATLLLMLGFQCMIQYIAGCLDIVFWLPGMIVAVLAMFVGIFVCCDLSVFDAGYCCARAFITAEFAASFGWQLFCFIFFKQADGPSWITFFVVMGVYGMTFGIIFFLESRRLPSDTRLNVTVKEFTSAIIIAVTVFAISNIYFVIDFSLFRDQTGAALFFIRTLVDFSGLTMLYAQQEQKNEMHLRYELEAMDSVLRRQYEQYKQSRDNIELLNRKTHDLKQQIAVIRLEDDPVKRESYIKEMEQVIKQFEVKVDTGNKILDIVLTAKNIYCLKHDITLTCVIDGSLISFMEVMDICTIFGNALDNAIESVMKLKEKEKRLIRMAVYSQNNLLMIRFENYSTEILDFEGGLPKTTKADKGYHGYGMKSIRRAIEKYGGNMTVHMQNDWFILRILIPI
ncbi:MAG TPA: GHKL domain-containing protein [Clostridiales bacterium]|nr:GHKL domain-containing protein [Clostridiales bacterium]